jgi:hypothetical protein
MRAAAGSRMEAVGGHYADPQREHEDSHAEWLHCRKRCRRSLHSDQPCQARFRYSTMES